MKNNLKKVIKYKIQSTLTKGGFFNVVKYTLYMINGKRF